MYIDEHNPQVEKALPAAFLDATCLRCLQPRAFCRAWIEAQNYRSYHRHCATSRHHPYNFQY